MPRLPGRLRRTATGPRPVRVPWALLDVLRDGPAALSGDAGDRAEAAQLHVAVVVPPFRRGSGGHATLANLMRGLEARGHRCSVWVDDDEGRHDGEDDAAIDALFKRFFGPLRATVRKGFGSWEGADVAVATGWQTAHRVVSLPGAAARAYVVQDHEPEFYGTSAERTWAEQTYALGLHCVAASPWLARVLRERYGASATHFDLGVDHATYRPLPVLRRDDLVLVYARAVTARRAVPLAVLALAELHRRRPQLELALFGEARPLDLPFPSTHLGVLPGERLAGQYNNAAAGVVLSMTNPSLVPTELLACACPFVDLDTPAMRETFGPEPPMELVAFDPLALADGIERVLDDPELRADRARAGLELAAGRTWDRAAGQVENGARDGLAAAAAAEAAG